MLETTLKLITAALNTDASLSAIDRLKLAQLIRTSGSVKNQSPPERVVRLIRRQEVAKRMACSLRTVDKLANSGVLPKRTLPGRVRASGFLESDVDTLIAGHFSPADYEINDGKVNL